jgi:hypothetical protein
MKKILNACLLLSFQFGYLEWSKTNHLFIFQAEKEIFIKAGTSPITLLHPFILVPLVGQIMLFITLFKQKHSRWLTLTGLATLSLLILFLLFIGFMAGNLKMISYNFLFVIVGLFVLQHNWKRQS